MFDIITETENLKGGAVKFGTENERGLLNRLGSPDRKYKIVHVAGTNGKGSVAEYISRALIAAGIKTGTFVSPAVMDFSDQIKINGIPLSRGQTEKYLGRAFAERGDCTSFEVLTAAALSAFADEGCSYAVVECGMGGLYDATNAVHSKELAVITSIGLEHTAFLGDTIEKICAHKAGIIKNCPAVISALQPPEAVKYFKNIPRAIFADRPAEIISSDFDGQSFLYGGEKFTIQMAGFAQVYNAAAAIEGARILGIGEKYIREGIASARLEGRLQRVVSGGRTFIVDGCHNPQSFTPLKRALSAFPPGEVTVVFGCLSDKDIEGNLGEIKGLAHRIIAVKPNSPRAMELGKIYAACKKYFADATTADGVAAALESSGGTTVVCGSFTLVKEALNWIGKRL